MTNEQREYGGGYVKCARCGVLRRLRSLHRVALELPGVVLPEGAVPAKALQCVDVASCTAHRAELAAHPPKAKRNKPRPAIAVVRAHAKRVRR